jgi:hypothetical protein
MSVSGHCPAEMSIEEAYCVVNGSICTCKIWK